MTRVWNAGLGSALLALFLAGAALGQVSDTQVQQYVKDGVATFDKGTPAEFEFTLSANVLDPQDSAYAEGTGYLEGSEKCYARFKVTSGGETTTIEWYENKGSAAVKIGGGPWQKASLFPNRSDTALFHWLSPVQVFKEIVATSSFFPDRSREVPEEKRLEIASDLSPHLETYLRRFGLDSGVNAPDVPPKVSAQIAFDTEKKQILEIGYSVIVTQRHTDPPKESGEDDWSWEDYEDGGGMADFSRPGKPKRIPKAAKGLVNYGYQARYEFRMPAKKKKPQQPKEAAALVPW